MRQHAFVIIAVLSLTGYGFAYDGVRAMDEADTYLRNGQYLEAIGAYQSISEQSDDPDAKARAILRIGDIYSHFLNNYDRAMERYAVVIKIYGKSQHAANAYFNSGMILYEKNRFEEALARFKAYIRKYPRGDRRETAEFMIETCLRPPPEAKEGVPDYKMQKGEQIRTLVMSDGRQVTVSSPSVLEVRDMGDQSSLLRVKNAAIDIADGTLRINGSVAFLKGIVVVPSEGDILKLNGNPYRGELRIWKNANGGLSVINVLDVESYLYGVVPREMSPRWHPEALKAQAIAARTYALYQKEKNKSRDYDVLANTSSQVYGGAGAESESSNRAVDDTRGMVILYGGRLILAYFHANSGGMTEDALRVWTADVPYLKAVRDEYSMKAPQCSWKMSLRLDEIRKSLHERGVAVGAIQKLIPAGISPSGRISRIKIFHGGKETVLSGNDFRIKIGPALMKSTLFTMVNDGDEVRFEGKGYGHGVGMSQWGAYVMAREGRSYGDILKHYYRGVEIGTP